MNIFIIIYSITSNKFIPPPFSHLIFVVALYAALSARVRARVIASTAMLFGTYLTRHLIWFNSRNTLFSSIVISRSLFKRPVRSDRNEFSLIAFTPYPINDTAFDRSVQIHTFWIVSVGTLLIPCKAA